MTGQGRGPGAAGTRSVILAAALCTAAFLSLVSCRRNAGAGHPTRPVLGTIEVEEASADPGKAGPLDARAVASVSRRALVTSGLVDPAVADAAAPAGAVLRVKITTGVEFTEVQDKGVLRAGVGVQLSTRPSDAPGAIQDDLSAGGEQAYGVTPDIDRHALAQKLVERTLSDLLVGFVARARLRTAPPAEIHAAITADGGPPALREEAIRVAGARRLRDEVPVLLPLLQNDNEAVRDAALGALIALREQRAVTVLTRNRSLRDRHEMRKILEAISMIGGDEARDYLNFVAQSHDDEEIRKLAADAKARLDRRAGH